MLRSRRAVLTSGRRCVWSSFQTGASPDSRAPWVQKLRFLHTKQCKPAKTQGRSLRTRHSTHRVCGRGRASLRPTHRTHPRAWPGEGLHLLPAPNLPRTFQKARGNSAKEHLPGWPDFDTSDLENQTAARGHQGTCLSQEGGAGQQPQGPPAAQMGDGGAWGAGTATGWTRGPATHTGRRACRSHRVASV